MLLYAGLAPAVGKIAGGFLADRFGWSRIGAGAVALSAPLLWLGERHPALGLGGLVLFHVPMAITLGLMIRNLPARPALAFGTASASLFAGAMFTPLLGIDSQHTLTALIALGTVPLLLLGIRSSARPGQNPSPHADTQVGLAP